MWMDDSYWLNAARWVIRLHDSYRYVLSPGDFNGLTPHCLPLEFSHILPPVDMALVIPKDDVDRLSLEWLKKLRNFSVLYADEVFVVLASDKRANLPSASEDQLKHMGRLWERLEFALAPQPARRTGIDTMLSDGASDKPFGILICSSQTGNAGDRLISMAAVELLRERWPELSWIVTSSDVDRYLAQRASCMVLGPGGYPYDIGATAGTADLNNIAAYFKFGFLANEYNKPLIMLGAGDQGIVTKLGRRFVAAAMENAQLAIVRHKETASLLLNQLHFSGPLLAADDLSVALAPRIREAGEALRSTETKTVTLCGYFGTHPAVNSSIIECLTQARQHGHFTIRFVAQAKEDYDWLQNHGQALMELGDVSMVDVRETEPDVFIKAIAGSDVLMTTRFHGMMVGLMAGIETLVFGRHDDKRHRVLAGLSRGAASFIDVENVQAAEMTETINYVFASIGQEKQRPAAFNQQSIDKIRQMLKGMELPAPLPHCL